MKYRNGCLFVEFCKVAICIDSGWCCCVYCLLLMQMKKIVDLEDREVGIVAVLGRCRRWKAQLRRG